MEPKYVLTVTSGSLRREVPVTGSLLVGRGPTCTIRLPDDYCSREHGRFEMRGDDLWLVDLRSRNGIFVNGERLLDEVRLDDGDEVRIGRSTLNVLRAAGESAATAAPRLEEAQTPELPREHDPHWWVATLEVDLVAKGDAPGLGEGGGTVATLYANSIDFQWREWIKPKAGQAGLWLLHRSEGELAQLAPFQLIHQEDLQPSTQLDALREAGIGDK